MPSQIMSVTTIAPTSGAGGSGVVRRSSWRHLQPCTWTSFERGFQFGSAGASVFASEADRLRCLPARNSSKTWSRDGPYFFGLRVTLRRGGELPHA